MKKINDKLANVIALLNDQQYYDGTSIGEQFNITRAAVWKVIKKLEAYDYQLNQSRVKAIC